MSHGKGTEDGVGAFLKSTARCATLSKGVHLFSPKDFYEFLVKDQFEKAKATGRLDPTLYILFSEAIEVEKIKNLVINPRIEKLRSTGNVHSLSFHFLTVNDYVGTLKGIRDMHEFEASFNKSISYRRISTASHSLHSLFNKNRSNILLVVSN